MLNISIEKWAYNFQKDTKEPAQYNKEEAGDRERERGTKSKRVRERYN